MGVATGFSDNNRMPDAPAAAIDCLHRRSTLDRRRRPAGRALVRRRAAGRGAGLDEATGGEVGRALGVEGVRRAPVRPVRHAGHRSSVEGRARRARRRRRGGGLRHAMSRGASRPPRRWRRGSAASHVLGVRAAARAGEPVRRHRRRAGFAQAVAEGLTLAEFNGAQLQDRRAPPPSAPRCTIVVPDAARHLAREHDAASRRAVARGRLLGECSNLARELANEPGNTLTPREFAARATALASEGGVAVEMLDERQIEALGMGLLLGVARGSSEPPRLMVFRHDPPGAPAGPVLGLVGKGITFDTGGISIKPADGMERMKDDMAGGAAVACAMRAIGHARRADPRHRRRAGDREHAGRPRDQAGRHSAERRRQDRRSDQHRCRRPAGARRRPVVRAQARRDASGRRRHADRRRSSSRSARSRAASSARPMRGSSRCAASPIAPAIACGRCRCSTTTASS